MKETDAVGYTNFRKTPNTAGGYANFQLKKYDMKAEGAGGYDFFQKTRHKATTLESANTISDTTTPAPASLAETRYLTENKLIEGVLNGSIPSAAYDTSCTSNASMVGDPFIQIG